MERKGTKDARYPKFLTTTPVDAPVKSEDDTANDGTGVSPEGGGSPAATSLGLRRREAYCLLVQVTCNVDSVSALDAKVPDYVWTEAVAWDICAYQVGTPANTFTIELLCDMEFLLFKGPRSRLGITWENAIKYIRVLYDIRDRGGTEVTVVAGQHTMRQSRIDLANTREYCWPRILGRLAAIEGKACMLALENAKTPTPMGRGQAYTRRAHQYLAQKVARGPALEPYVMIQVQFPRIPSYDENQVALVIRDRSEFSRRVIVIIGTPMIDWVVQALKESEIDTIPEEWQRARRRHEFVNGFFVRSINPTEPMPTNTNQDPLDLNEKVFLKNKCTIPGFESMVVRARTHRKMMMGYRLNVITHAPYVEDWVNLPVGVYVVPTYSELRDGSQSVAVVLRNLMGKLVHLLAGRVITRVLTANIIPEGKPTLELIKKTG